MEKDGGGRIGCLVKRYPLLDCISGQILTAFLLMEECYKRGNKILIAGNGGSACDAQHMVAELMKSFLLKRELSKEEKKKMLETDFQRGSILASKLQGALPAIALDSHAALNTAFANDMDGRLCFAQQVYAYGRKGDLFLGITTSGNSENILFAAVTARALGMKAIGFTGQSGGKVAEIVDFCVKIPATQTYEVQELQQPVYHCWCQMLEEEFFRR